MPTTTDHGPVHVEQLIAGRWRDGSGAAAHRRNPARPQDEVATVVTATSAEVDAAVSAARQAHAEWARTPLHARAAILSRAAGVLEAAAPSLGEELTREEGKTRAEGVAEVTRAAQILRYCAGEADRQTGELYASPRPDETIAVVRRPVGVVAAITPWNFPIAIPAWKIAPALVHGNCVVWKPASLVPLLAFRLAGALVDAGLPPGVLSLVIGPGPVGEYLATHGGVDAVTFTGSTGVGRGLIAKCGALAKPIQTEMGGKNAAIVLRDAPVAEAAAQVFGAAMMSTGQKCTATSRLIVERDVADDLLSELRRLVEACVVGDGLDPQVQMGPAVSSQAQGEILQAIRAAREEGADVLAGGEPYAQGSLAEGSFVPPTLVRPASSSAAVWQEEVFGPVLAVRAVDSADEAFAVANDSPFGLSASVFTNDLRQVSRAVATLEVGVLHVNSETSGADPHVPFGGTKQSGYGPKEQGRAAREFFTETMTVYQRPLG